jgi:hypothetical protein
MQLYSRMWRRVPWEIGTNLHGLSSPITVILIGVMFSDQPNTDWYQNLLVTDTLVWISFNQSVGWHGFKTSTSVSY